MDGCAPGLAFIEKLKATLKYFHREAKGNSEVGYRHYIISQIILAF